MTDRLVLRQWRDDDLDAWAAINADPSVREFLGGIQSREQAAGALARFRADIESRGRGWWALEEKATGTLIGMAGLDPVEEEVPFTGVEIGWRLSPASWGKGPPAPSRRSSTGSCPPRDNQHSGARRIPRRRPPASRCGL